MVNDLVNINKFIKSLNTNNINSIDLMQQYYYHEIRKNIEIYNELIEKLDNIFSLFNITIEQEQKYNNFFIFLKEEIIKTKKKYQENYKYEIEQIAKILDQNQQTIDNYLVVNNKYSIIIASLNNKKITKWKNNFLKIITFGFWDWNKKITVQQEELENYKINNEELIKGKELENEKLKQEKTTILIEKLKKNMFEITSVLAEVDILEKEFKKMLSEKTNNEPECEIAEEAIEVLSKKRSPFCSQDSGFDSNASRDSEESSYPEKLNPFINDDDVSSQSTSIFSKPILPKM
ncbi:hypothetical protein [Spiroplasma endosymbiont of Aleiodes alternator]|uniref:hypothetical protein n=1 Tax=Spiroplasma endosymbiont of Aleiodes alternator TaxID=3139329 RepID=UPI003CCB4464